MKLLLFLNSRITNTVTSSIIRKERLIICLKRKSVKLISIRFTRLRDYAMRLTPLFLNSGIILKI